MSIKDLKKIQPGDKVRWKRGWLCAGCIETIKEIIPGREFGIVGQPTQFKLLGYWPEADIFFHDLFTKA